jgi:inorganic pyrophosphatase
LLAGSVVSARLVGVLQMEDEKGRDEKLIAVPTSKLTPLYDGIKTHADLPPLFCQQVQHFFEHYKDLEKGKWVKILSWDGPDVAQSLVTDAMKRLQENL